MKIGVIAAALVGLALFVWLLLHIGIGQVWAAIVSVGFGGFALLCVAAIAVVGLLGSAWAALIPRKTPRHLLTFVIGRQTRDSAGDILPFSQLGGIVIGTRAVILRGI